MKKLPSLIAKGMVIHDTLREIPLADNVAPDAANNARKAFIDKKMGMLEAVQDGE